MKEYKIIPVPKPRQTRSDKWKKRDCVMRYRAFADQVHYSGMTLPECCYHIIFVLPMPASWSKKKKAEMDGKPHRQRPDRDNLEKALLDALYDDDSHIWDGRTTKIWGREGKIIIKEIEF